MNIYGARIRDRWKATAPSRYAQLENPMTFFEEMGERVLERVVSLSNDLAGPDPKDEQYLQKVSRLSTARRQAEEIAMAELEWPDPELSAIEARAEWEATTANDQTLADWAASLEEQAGEEVLAPMAEAWMLPMNFLRELSTAKNPWIYLAEHSETMQTSRDLRFQRDLRK